MSEELFSDVKKEIESSDHFKDSQHSNKHYTHGLVHKSFIFAVFSIALFLVITKDDWLDVNSIVYFLLLAVVILMISLVVIKLDKWVESNRYQFFIRLCTSILILLFFIYQLFTPYFYSDHYLEKVATEKIEAYFQLSNDELSDQQWEELAKSSLTEEMAFSTLQLVNFPYGSIVEVVEIDRSYYLFDITIEVEPQFTANTEEVAYRFTLNQVDGDFKIDGYQVLN